MPRRPRACPGGHVYHIWNRAAGRLRMFKKDADYLAFEKILLLAHARHPIALLDWVLMPNHWHFVVYPKRDGQVTDFFRWLTHTHSMRWHTSRGAVGIGPLYQGRFKSLPVQQDEHLEILLRYVERNPLRAGEVRRARDWRWGSAAVRAAEKSELKSLLSPWPIDMPPNWNLWVDEPQMQAEVQAVREVIKRSRPFGEAAWTQKIAGKLQLDWTLRPRGRPLLEKNDGNRGKELRRAP
jgi:putative transposase